MTTELPGFAEFWSVFPKKRDKLAAVKMYDRALKLTTPDVILTAARRYAEERARDVQRRGQEIAMQYTKHPATWLNGGCWDDYGMQPTAPPIKLTHGAPTVNGGIYVMMDTPEWNAWCRYLRSQGKVTPPYSRAHGGWTFPSLLPPQLPPRAPVLGEGVCPVPTVADIWK